MESQCSSFRLLERMDHRLHRTDQDRIPSTHRQANRYRFSLQSKTTCHLRGRVHNSHHSHQSRMGRGSPRIKVYTSSRLPHTARGASPSPTLQTKTGQDTNRKADHIHSDRIPGHRIQCCKRCMCHRLRRLGHPHTLMDWSEGLQDMGCPNKAFLPGSRAGQWRERVRTK